MKLLRRYDFSERLAELLGESRRDLRVRVTLLVAAGLFTPGARGPAAPPATAEEAALLLLAVLAAPQQSHTVAAARCYRALTPTSLSAEATLARVLTGPDPLRREQAGAEPPLQLPAGTLAEALAALLAAVHDRAAAAELAGRLFGVWVSRGFPVAGIQAVVGSGGDRALLTRRYELPDGGRPPAWLDPAEGGTADPGLLHTVFLPAARLIEIGRLTAPPPSRSAPSAHERSRSVLDLGSTLNDVAGLARRVGHRKPWKTFLDKAGEALAALDSLDPAASRLREVVLYGDNPGNLKMFAHVPDGLADGAALVVILHGCTQTALSYDVGTGWTALAERHGFAVLAPEQKRTNNPLRCFNWFKPEDTGRDGGEVASIQAMVAQLVADHRLDGRRIYVSGVSAGGALTAALLAACPDVFAGGAIIAGVPHGSANGLQDAFEVIFQGRSRPAAEWGALVRAAAPDAAGPWPSVAIWHGDADSTVTPLNAEELIKQWCNVHDLATTPTIEDEVDGHRRRVWQDDQGRDLIEAVTVTGMSHGVPIDPGSDACCGVAGPFIIDAGISSTSHIARSWGLTETVRDPGAGRLRPVRAAATTPEPARQEELARAGERAREGAAFAGTGAGSAADATAGLDLQTVLARSFEAARLLDQARRTRPVAEAPAGSSGSGRPGSGRDGWPGPTGASIAGVDIGQILATSFQAAGLIQPGPGAAARPTPSGSGPLGIDIPGIIAASFEAAGLGRGRSGPTPNPRRAAPAGPAEPPASTGPAEPSLEPSPEPSPEPLAAPAPAAPSPAAPASADRAAGVPGWDGEGWQLLPGHGRGDDAAPTLHGEALSGSGGAIERAVRTVSCRLVVAGAGGASPHLRYRRRLSLRAAVNPFTRADFAVLVDGEVVDEVSAAGLDHVDADWTESAAIDLGRFAGREVVLAFELAASTNVFVPVSAEAWIRDLRIGPVTGAST